jgi:hypothetical protein
MIPVWETKTRLASFGLLPRASIDAYKIDLSSQKPRRMPRSSRTIEVRKCQGRTIQLAGAHTQASFTGSKSSHFIRTIPPSLPSPKTSDATRHDLTRPSGLPHPSYIPTTKRTMLYAALNTLHPIHTACSNRTTTKLPIRDSN